VRQNPDWALNSIDDKARSTSKNPNRFMFAASILRRSSAESSAERSFFHGRVVIVHIRLFNGGADNLTVIRMKPFVAVAILVFPAIFPAAAGCQSLPSLNALLDRLDAYAKQYQDTLPSLSCDEQITSQALNRKGRVTSEIKARSTLREVRTEDPYSPFLEQREFKNTSKRHPTRTSQMPYFVEGAFAGLVGFKRWQQRECFDYAVTSGDNGHTVRLEMTLKAKLGNPACARLPAGFDRVVIADPETGRILHTERTIAPEGAATNDEVYFGAIDYAPQQIGGQEFLLPLRFYSHDANNTGRMFATYSNCHRYAGELKILPSTPGP
jgi:hypothetical protein